VPARTTPAESDAPIAPDEVARSLESARITFGASRSIELARFLNLLVKWNRTYNLTGIRDRRELLARHLVESLALGPLLRGPTVADIGTGAGLPGLPLAICDRDRAFTLIESRRKRVSFLRHVCAELDLDHVTVAHCRAEDLPRDRSFATVLARAVAPPAELIEIVRPLTAPGSILLLLTSAGLGPEIARLADDFIERAVDPAPPAGLKSSIILLERR
jgi:16S rRNA (guanine527-N7)-methyltransferase